MKQQVVLLHGGTTFATHEEYLEYLRNYTIDFDRLAQKRWKDNLAQDLGENFEVIRPEMPDRRDSKYCEWAIWFEKYVPLLKDGVVLVGHSLGGLFVAKYLNEHDLECEIGAVILVAAPYDADGSDRSLADFELMDSLTKLRSLGIQMYLLQSEDDAVVHFQNLKKFALELPRAQIITFNDRGHFDQEHFPELEELIRNLATYGS